MSPNLAPMFFRSPTFVGVAKKPKTEEHSFVYFRCSFEKHM